MKRILFAILLLSGTAFGQAWSGILDPNRAVDWSGAGVLGGIPNRTTICSTLNPGATAAQINSAIAACGTGQVVMLNAGSYTLSGGIVFAKSNVTLRGAGAHLTKLTINGATGGCHLFYNSAIAMCLGSFNLGVDSPDHTATWSAGYAKGTTQITLSSTTGLAVGSTIWVDQNNDASDGWPAVGDIYVCDNTSNACSNQGGGSWYRGGRALTEGHIVTNIAGSVVTISPPIMSPNYRSGQSPGAWWGDTSHIMQNSGIENLSVDFSGVGSGPGLQMVNCTNCWVAGTRWVYDIPAQSFVFHNVLVNVMRVTIRDNYYFGPNSPPAVTNYQISPHVASMPLIENNILQHVVSGLVPNDPTIGAVYGYNFVTDSYYTGPGVILHDPGDMMNLYEGNNMSGFMGDVIHGRHFFGTLNRNLLSGKTYNPPANVDTVVILETGNRFFNLVGNVLGGSSYNTYQVLQAANQNAIYGLGWQGDASGTGVPGNDTNVNRTTMRWGNWDTVTSTNDNGTNDQTGTRFVSAEVPSGIANFPNPVPASQTLPASFYLPSKPAWFGSIPWPPIGPDVTSGNIANYGGHANIIPAQACFNAAATDSAYGGLGVKVFDAATCYAAAPGGSPGVQFSPTSWSFGGQLVGTASSAKAIVVTNNGTAALTINSISANGDFTSGLSHNCPLTPSSLAASDTCTVNVIFSPLFSGSRTGSLSVTSDAAGSPHTVALSGTGTVNRVVGGSHTVGGGRRIN